MAARKFKFISPGVYINEVDESVINPVPPILGPMVVGRTRTGPAMRPVRVENYQQFVDVFGHPVGSPEGSDIWRENIPVGPTYAAYAAKAWLNAEVSPVNVIRLLGEDHESSVSNATKAGWKTNGGTNVTAAGNMGDLGGGAYGLWVFDSGSTTDTAAIRGGTAGLFATGSLAAIWYLNKGSVMVLSGTNRCGVVNQTGTAVLLKNDETGPVFRTILKNYTGAATEVDSRVFEFDFTTTGGRYIRDVFNTNPVMTNADVVKTGDVTENKNDYWLGESFDREIQDKAISGNSWGMILPVLSGTAAANVNWDNRQNNFINPKTGWFFSQDFGANANFSGAETSTKLFRFVSRDHGAAGHKVKIAIEDIKASPNTTNPYGRFTVAVYPIDVYDKAAKNNAIEKFTNCNLNPNSTNYVAKRIGDKYAEWSYSLNKFTEYGQYNNLSDHIRIEMNPALDVDFNAASLPFGVTGPIRPLTGFYESGSLFIQDKFYQQSSPVEQFHTYITGGNIFGATKASGLNEESGYTGNAGSFFDVAGAIDTIPFSGTFPFPAIALRSGSDHGADLGSEAFFGVSLTTTQTSRIFDPSVGDYQRGLPFGSTVYGRFDELTGLPKGAEYSWQFTLDDIKIDGKGNGAYVSGSRVAGTSVTAVSSSYKKILDHHDRFWTVMYGGHDGLDVTEAEPFRNSQWTAGTTTKYDHYAFNSIDRSLASVKDIDMIEYNLLTVPGITNTDLTDRVLEVAEERADALGIIDIANVFTPSTENTESFSTNLGSVDTAVTSIQTRDLNTSYGCTYYPWVQIKDTRTDVLVWTPPSIIALGTMASSEANTELWFAPAGFNRGGLTKGPPFTAGVPVVSVSERLTQKQRDKLYENNINPIARFPSEGIVVFGQKTLQATDSALDRINVRRLLIYLKKEVSRMSADVLFDNNLPATWNRFTSMVNPFLASVQSRFGLSDYKVILDETTTTPDLVDRNIMYAKIFIKPARAIEFIALDFIITKSGASFED